jgi:hypothetical protein
MHVTSRMVDSPTVRFSGPVAPQSIVFPTNILYAGERAGVRGRARAARVVRLRPFAKLPLTLTLSLAYRGGGAQGDSPPATIGRYIQPPQ